MSDDAERANTDPNAASGDAPAPDQPEKRKNPVVRYVLLAVLVVALVGGGLWFLRYQTRGKYYETTNDAFVQTDAVIVSSKVAGFVERVFVADNQSVKAGQPLLQIDPRDYRARAEQYRAQIGVAEASADSVRAQVREQQATVAQARAQLASAQADSAFASAEVARHAPLAATGAESAQQLAQLRSEAQKAAAAVAAARAGLSAAERRVATLEAQVTQAQAQGRAAEAQLSAADVDLGSTIIRASSAGRIGDKSVQPGQFVQPGLRMMSIVPVQSLYIEANFKETQVALMRPGQPVEVKVDALDGVTLHGKIESFSPGTGAQFSLLPPQNATGNFTKIVQRIPVRIALEAGPEARRLLLPGMSVEVTVDTYSARDERERIEREEEARKNRK